jgi:hypothetical protein
MTFDDRELQEIASIKSATGIKATTELVRWLISDYASRKS